MPEYDFNAAVREHQPKLYRTACFFAGDRKEGGELFQDALAEALQNWNETVARNPIFPWLCGLLVRRFEQRQHERKPAATRLAVAGPRDSQTALLWTTLNELPPKQRGVLVLRYAEDMSLEQIAEALREPPAAVKSRLGEAHTQTGATLRSAGIGKPKS
jgi:RNA polymerase sigma factor (sigma-70 family)